MKRIKKVAIILRLIDRLREKGSWCGEIHIQNNIFFLQELIQVPIVFKFILYKRGPFSFDLRDELTSIRADGLIELEPHYSFSPKIVPTNQSEYIQKICSKTLAKYDDQISFVANNFGEKDVVDLRHLATALYIIKNTTLDTNIEERFQELTRLKPNIGLESAKTVFEEIYKIAEKANIFINY